MASFTTGEGADYFRNKALSETEDLKRVVNTRLTGIVGHLKAGEFTSGHILLAVQDILEAIDKLRNVITKA